MISLLYVDDDPGLRDIVKVFLEQTDQFTVETVPAAISALEILKTRHFDAIISDYQMPGMDGIIFLKEVRKRDEDIPFILFTGRGREEVVIEAINNGADFYLQKGGDPESQFAELIHKIRQAVVRRRAQDELKTAYDNLARSEEELRSQIEEIEHAQQEREKTEQNFRNLVENAPDAMYIQTNQRFVYLNMAAVRLLGAASAHELLGKNFFERIHPSFHDRIHKRVETLTVDLQPVELLEEIYLRLDGIPVNVEVKAVPFQYKGEHGVLVILRDITVRKRAEAELHAAYEQISAAEKELREHYEELARNEQRIRESELKFRAIIDQSIQFIGLMTVEGTLIEANRPAIAFIGVSPSEVLGRPFWETPWWVHSEELQERLKRAVQRAAAGETVQFEATHVANDGRLVYVDFSIKPVVDANGNIIYLIPEGRDITWRKHAEVALRESEEKYRSVVEQSQDGIFIAQNGLLVFHNPVLSKMTGYTSDELQGRSIADLIAPEDRSLVMTRHQERLKGKVLPEVYEFSLLHHDGKSRILVRMAVAPTTYLGIPATIGTVHNIVEDRQREDTLRESEEKYRTLVEINQDIIYSLDIDGNVIFVSPQVTEQLGFKPNELEGRDFRELIHPDDIGTLVHHIQQNFTPGKQVITDQFRVRRKDGIYRWYEDKSIYTHDNQGRHIVIGTIRDITERKEAEEALRKSEEQYRIIIENIHEGFVRGDKEGRILMASPSAARMMGFVTVGEMIGISLASLYRNPLDRDRMLDQLAKQGRVDGYQTEFQRKDNSTFWGSIDAHLLPGEDGEIRGTEALIRDITERRIMESAIREANRKLNLLNSITRHDVANQLTILQGYAQLAGESEPGTAIDSLAKIESAAQTISRMLEFTRTYQELGEHAPGWFRIHEMVEKTGISRVRMLNACREFEIFADPMLERVFYNIFDNAFRHGESVTEIVVACQNSPGGLDILIEDNGAGIPVNEKEKIFERGYGKNTGWGLFLVREILSITGITICETGTEGKGARFEIRVPRGVFRRLASTSVQD